MNLESLLVDNAESIIFECLSGSHSYGLNTPASDEDYKGIFIFPASAYLSLEAPVSQVSDEKNDVVYYSLLRFFELALNANPNIIELLFMPEDCIRKTTPFYTELQDSRSLFITKQAYESHVGYAHAQIKKARGQNKWVNNPQPKIRPKREDFCWYIDTKNTASDGMPLRPKLLVDAGIELSHCHAAALEHTTGMYRIYYYGSEAKGVFRGGSVVCESIPIDDEHKHFIGLLSDNEPAYDRAVRDHRNYWDWRDNRNEKRWEAQEEGLMDYDAKNMMHTFRLLLSGESMLQEGVPMVRFEGQSKQFLLDVRNGKFSYEELIQQAESKVHALGELCDRCELPQQANQSKVDSLLKEITSNWEGNHFV